MRTDGKGVMAPIQKLMKLVKEVMVTETAASEYVSPSLSTTLSLGFVLLHEANITNESSIPIPKKNPRMRKPYKQDAIIDLTEKEPFSIFEDWFRLACKTDEIKEANAMALSTADKNGRPSSRYVLLKGYGRDGFCFFTNYESRKGKELNENPYATLLFYWEALNRQIRIEGKVERLSEKISEDYFHSRPRSSQIAAVVSHQSCLLRSREELINKKEELETLYEDESKIIPKPEYWGGYRLAPDVMEFWQGQTNRLHDRIRFRLLKSDEVPDETETFSGKQGWVYERLSP